jgi:hypothetical protein
MVKLILFIFYPCRRLLWVIFYQYNCINVHLVWFHASGKLFIKSRFRPLLHPIGHFLGVFDSGTKNKIQMYRMKKKYKKLIWSMCKYLFARWKKGWEQVWHVIRSKRCWNTIKTTLKNEYCYKDESNCLYCDIVSTSHLKSNQSIFLMIIIYSNYYYNRWRSWGY